MDSGASLRTMKQHELITGEKGTTRSSKEPTVITTVNGKAELREADQDWHVFCQAIFQGIERAKWETMYYKYKELHKAVHFKKSVQNMKAKTLWTWTEAKDNGRDCYDLSSVLQIETGDPLRHAPWEIHVGNPTAALDEAEKHTEELGRAQSSAASEM